MSEKDDRGMRFSSGMPPQPDSRNSGYSQQASGSFSQGAREPRDRSRSFGNDQEYHYGRSAPVESIPTNRNARYSQPVSRDQHRYRENPYQAGAAWYENDRASNDRHPEGQMGHDQESGRQDFNGSGYPAYPRPSRSESQRYAADGARPTANVLGMQKRKVAFICLAVLVVIVLIWALSSALSGGSSAPEGDSADAAGATAQASVEGDGGQEGSSGSEEPVIPEYVPPTSDDPRIATSSMDNETNNEGHTVYLTFDDGPSDLTPKILKILQDNDVKATWFVMGKGSNLDMLQKIWACGHQIGLHTDTHKYTTVYKNKDSFFTDLDAIGKKVNDRLGFTPSLIRFPGGSVNSYNSKCLAKIKKELDTRNWHYFDWNVSSEDAVSAKTRSKKQIISTVKKTSADKHSVCLLMHDTNAKQTTVDALDSIIKYYKKQGFEFKYLTSESYGYHF